MILTWKPNWYELDQTVIVGDIGYFYLDKAEKEFANEMDSFEDKEVRGEIIRITHREIGELKGILTIGLSYQFILNDGKYIQVDAEEQIGKIEYPDSYKVIDWVFNVELDVLEMTGYSSQERLACFKKNERIMLEKGRKERYRSLLGIDYI